MTDNKNTVEALMAEANEEILESYRVQWKKEIKDLMKQKNNAKKSWPTLKTSLLIWKSALVKS